MNQKSRTIISQDCKKREQQKLLELLACPISGESLEYDIKAQELISRKASLAYPIVNGVPVMLVSEARELS